MTRQEILDQYEVNADGVIRSPGKFEGEMLYAPFYYDHGQGNETWTSGVSEDAFAEIFRVTAEDRKEFPELGRTKYVAVEEDDQGFVHLTEWTSEREARKAQKDYEESEENPRLRRRRNPGSRWHGRQATEAEGDRIRAEDRGSIIGSHFYRGKREAHRESQDASRAMGLNPSSAYDVFLRGKKIDTVFQSDPSSAEEVKRSLVEHDGYDPDIRVVKQRKRKSPPPLFRRRRNPGYSRREKLLFEEVRAIAKNLARRGLTGKRGDSLPPLISSAASNWINAHVTEFQQMVALEKDWLKHPIDPFKRKNPGAAWHKEQEQLAEDMEKRETRPRRRTYLRGMADAHTLSEHESRKMGLNPRKIGKRQFVAVRYVTSRNTVQLRLTSGEVVDIQPHVLKRFSPDIFNRVLTYPNAWVEVSGTKQNPRGSRTLVGRVFKAERWAKRWARGRPIRKVKGGWQILAGRTRSVAQERAHRRTVRNPDIEMTFNSKAKAVRYASAMRKLGHDIEVVKGQYGTWKTIIHETRKNPIAVFNPPPGRMIYGRVLSVEAQKTNGSHRGKKYRHDFAGDSRVAAYALQDGSVLLKSTVGKRLWQDR